MKQTRKASGSNPLFRYRFFLFQSRLYCCVVNLWTPFPRRHLKNARCSLCNNAVTASPSAYDAFLWEELDPGSWCIRGTDKSTPRENLSFPQMYRDPRVILDHWSWSRSPQRNAHEPNWIHQHSTRTCAGLERCGVDKCLVHKTEVRTSVLRTRRVNKDQAAHCPLVIPELLKDKSWITSKSYMENINFASNGVVFKRVMKISPRSFRLEKNSTNDDFHTNFL